MSIRKFLHYVASVVFITFRDSVQLKYVGMDVYDSHNILMDISLALSKLKIVSTVRSKNYFTSDDLFSNFTVFFSLLLINVMLLSFCLLILLKKNALRVAGSRASQKLHFPDIFTLTISLLQEQFL